MGVSQESGLKMVFRLLGKGVTYLASSLSVMGNL